MTHDDPMVFCSAMQCVRWPCCRPLAVVTRRCSAAVACGQIGGETCFTRKLEIKYSANTGECGAQGKHGHCTGQSVVGGRYTTELGTFYSCYHLNILT